MVLSMEEETGVDYYDVSNFGEEEPEELWLGETTIQETCEFLAGNWIQHVDTW